MVRLTRAEQQELTRRKVVDAARAEFAEYGYRGATVDGIAERAELTRGAVYSNFPGKRALYLAVLADGAAQAPPPSPRPPGGTPRSALAAFAGTWIEQIPRSSGYVYDASEQLNSPMLGVDLLPEIQGDARLRHSFGQLIQLDAILLGLALGGLDTKRKAPPQRFIHTAEALLTVLYGATQLSFAAPDFIDPDRVIELCEQIATLRPGPDAPRPAPKARRTRRIDRPWSPPACFDAVRAERVVPHGDRLVVVVGMHRITTIQDVLSAAPHPHPLTVALVTGDDTGELVPLARLALADVGRSLRHGFPASALPDLQLVVDEAGAVATACGIEAFDDETETAVVVRDERLVLRADGRGACHAVTGWLNST
ncbi:TetR/AcrR family transcriptional regulator [Nocardia sp. BMG51109]|uniref:TetR/AcrR family transcriptional regulator n=1 Tax=Nocardia sp. BMG51109 TaxID=1056816 RepID=UPI0004640D02|nr:TetR/AcrR family transcriptional regulator [Nocardia sp. BMG51109]